MPAAAKGLVVVVQSSAAAAREVTASTLDRAWREALAQGGLSDQQHSSQVSPLPPGSPLGRLLTLMSILRALPSLY